MSTTESTTEPKRCPKCGASCRRGTPRNDWECGSFVDVLDKRFYQSAECRITLLETEMKTLREIATLLVDGADEDATILAEAWQGGRSEQRAVDAEGGTP